MSESPAATIRRAAVLMRERVRELCPLPWKAEGRDVLATQDYSAGEDGWLPDWDHTFNVAACPRQDEAEHIASWHPVAVAGFAAALEVLADEMEADCRDGLLTAAALLNAARLYLGEPVPAEEAGIEAVKRAGREAWEKHHGGAS